MTVVLDSHFHCPACGPLVYGVTPAVCGQPIPVPVVVDGRVRTRKCPACKAQLRAHKKGHRR